MSIVILKWGLIDVSGAQGTPEVFIMRSLYYTFVYTIVFLVPASPSP